MRRSGPRGGSSCGAVPAERRIVLVDDQTGVVLMNNDLINEAKNRVVCDDNERRRGARRCATRSVRRPRRRPRASRAARPRGVADVDTRLRPRRRGLRQLPRLRRHRPDRPDRPRHRRRHQGARPDGALLLHGPTCPYANAFWNGSQMYYGNGLRGRRRRGGPRDDPRRHRAHLEPRLLGSVGRDERVDLRHHGRDHRPPERRTAATCRPQLGAGRGPARLRRAIRNIQDPTLFGDPDRTWKPATTSRRSALLPTPTRTACTRNSGVGNKTFYLASQGGTFNGQTITGIDTGDPTLTKSAKLWLLVDQTLTSGSDYADEAEVLEQSCEALHRHRGHDRGRLHRGAPGHAGHRAAEHPGEQPAAGRTRRRRCPTRHPAGRCSTARPAPRRRSSSPARCGRATALRRLRPGRRTRLRTAWSNAESTLGRTVAR